MSSTEQQASGVERTDLQQHDLGIPGGEVVQNRVDLSPEAPAFEHTHPGEQITYVLEGEMLAALREFQAPYREGGGGLR